jgi:carotenoid 9,10(9',10')-cleavage dioxygenase 1
MISCCLQFGDYKGWLGLLVMIFQSVFGPLLMPAKYDKLLFGPVGSTALQWHNDKLLALMEGGVPFLLRLCGGAIKSISAFTFGGCLDHAFTAHPKVDPKSGEMLSFVYRYFPSCR